MRKQLYLCLMNKHVIILGELERKKSNFNNFISLFSFFIGFIATVYVRDMYIFSFEVRIKEIILSLQKVCGKPMFCHLYMVMHHIPHLTGWGPVVLDASLTEIVIALINT